MSESASFYICQLWEAKGVHTKKGEASHFRWLQNNIFPLMVAENRNIMQTCYLKAYIS